MASTGVIRETGQVVDIEEMRRRGGPQLKGFVMVFPELIDSELSGGEIKLILALARRADVRTNVASYTLGELASDLGITEKHVSSNLARAANRSAMRKMGRGRAFVNPHLCWRGSPTNREIARFYWANPKLEYKLIPNEGGE